MTTYIAILRKEPDSDFGVMFPDFPGCITVGETLQQAHERAVEALAFHIEGMREDGEPIPDPSALDAVLGDPEHRGGVPLLVQYAAAPRERKAS